MSRDMRRCLLAVVLSLLGAGTAHAAVDTRVNYFQTANKRGYCEVHRNPEAPDNSGTVFCVLYLPGGHGPSWPTVSLPYTGRAKTQRLVGNSGFTDLPIIRYGMNLAIKPGGAVPGLGGKFETTCTSRAATGFTCRNLAGHGFRFKSRGISTF